jgi:S1-C subfamily serine protease
MKADDLIVAVNGQEATSGGDLLLRIAFEKPRAKLSLTLLDPKTRGRRDITLITVALPAS